MGQRVIDIWAQNKVREKFVWGLTDCHQLLYEFVRLHNPQWKDPHNVGAFRGTYSTWREANSIAKTICVSEWLNELGYVERPVNRLETGDIVKIETDSRSYDLYMPVIFGETVIVGDPKTKQIVLRHITQFNKNYKVFRRTLCQEQ